MTTSHLPDSTRIRHVHLRVRDLNAALQFYCGVLGLECLPGSGLDGTVVGPAGGEALVVLTEDARAPVRPPKTTGLYHFALRYPTRRDLAHAVRRLVEHQHPIQGASDHGVSEAIYVADPEGNGIELYADRPRDAWPVAGGQIVMKTAPLDIREMLALASSTAAAEAAPAQTDIGHIHLHVAELGSAERFFREFLGFDVTFRGLSSALFFSAGGYHHHVGINTWAGANAASPECTGLIAYRFEVPINDVLYCLRHRAPLAGYEAHARKLQSGAECLRIRDPNGSWLEMVGGVFAKSEV